MRKKKIRIIRIDAQELRYPMESSDKVLCLLIMDFVEDSLQATRKILRVFKEGILLGFSLDGDTIRHSSNLGEYLKIPQDLPMQMALGILYIPIIFRSKKSAYAYRGLEAMLVGMRQAAF